MDRLTSSLLNAFCENQGLQSFSTSRQFEYFANYCVVNHEYGTTDFDLDDISTGDDTQGIDGIAIIVNQRLVETIDDIEQLIALNQSIIVKFVVIQSKTSESFNNAELMNLTAFTRVFFDGDCSIFTSIQMKKFIELKDYIFSRGDKLRKNPELKMYYVTVGNWVNDSNILATATVGINSLQTTNLFSKVDCVQIGASEIQKYYRDTNNKLTSTFKFEKRITMYSKGESELGYCGLIPFKEYKKIIMDENGTVKPVFEDNIRDFLGPNLDVNKEIRSSIESGDSNAFCMLNNGITIVTNSITIPGDMASIEDYQIVNGCQTSHMLIECVESGYNIDDLLIPIRIIATKDEELKNNITKATNNQTSVKKEQLEALSTFQKKLEEYYKTFTDEYSLVYERRTGQYRDSSIPKTRIVSIAMQIKAVSAMFLDEPSAVSGQYGTVSKRVGNKLFKATDRPIIYYVSALSLFTIEALFRSGVIDRKYRRARYHAIMLFRLVVEDERMPERFNERKMERYCQKLLDCLNDSTRCNGIFSRIIEFIVLHGAEIEIDNRKCFERKETTDFLLGKVEELKQFISST